MTWFKIKRTKALNNLKIERLKNLSIFVYKKGERINKKYLKNKRSNGKMIRKWIVDRMADVWRLHAKLSIKIAVIVKELRSRSLTIILGILGLVNLIFVLLWAVLVSVALILLGLKPDEYLGNTMNEIYEAMTGISQRG